MNGQSEQDNVPSFSYRNHIQRTLPLEKEVELQSQPIVPSFHLCERASAAGARATSNFLLSRRPVRRPLTCSQLRQTVCVSVYVTN